jgi:hypothetical protein
VRKIAAGIVVALFLGATSAAFAGPCALEDLKWMQGVWRADSGERQTEERWIAGPDHVLFGSSWTMVKGKPAFVESMMIGIYDAKPGLRLRHFARDLGHAMEDTDAPMLFNLASCDAAVAVFEGQGNKIGERITYQRTGDQLSFIGDFLREGKPFQVKVEFRRAAD